MNHGFIKLLRSKQALELLRRPKCFALLALIALRARRSQDVGSPHLRVGEALIGDLHSVGLTEQEYRTAKRFLEATSKVTTKATSKGTVVKLIDKRIFDINADEPTTKATTKITTNKKYKERKKKYIKVENNKHTTDYLNFRRKFLDKASVSAPTYEDLKRAA